MDTDIIALPQLAPLNTRMALYLLGLEKEEFCEQMRRSASGLLDHLADLESRVHTTRDRLFAAMRQQKPVTVEWLRSAVLPSKKAHPREPRERGVTRDTFARWYKEGKLRKAGHGKPDLENVAAIIISSEIIGNMPEEAGRRFASPVPPITHPDDEILWCFRQAPPRAGRSSPLLPCPWPVLPRELEPGTLLVSGWPVFDTRWTQYPGIGAVCFSSLDEESLAAWDSAIDAEEVRHLLANMRKHVSDEEFGMLRRRTLHSYGQAILNRLAPGRLLALPTVRDYPLIWPSEVIWPREII